MFFANLGKAHALILSDGVLPRLSILFPPPKIRPYLRLQYWLCLDEEYLVRGDFTR